MPTTVNADFFRLVSTMQSTEETRYYLNGVNIEPAPDGGALLVATDGHRLLVAWDKGGEVENPAIVSLSKDALKACKPGKLESSRKLIIDHQAQTATVKNGEGEPIVVSHRAIVDGTFPDWRRVVPEMPAEPPVSAPGFNANYLASFSSVSDQLAKAVGSSNGMVVFAKDTVSPSIIRFDASPNFIGVLMPLRHSVESALPSFLARIEPESKAA